MVPVMQLVLLACGPERFGVVPGGKSDSSPGLTEHPESANLFIVEELLPVPFTLSLHYL